MNAIEIILIGVSLSCDAFAVAFSKGISIKKIKIYHAIKIGLFFGIFQGIMPVIGYLLSNSLGIYLVRFSHLIGFIILFVIGFNMYKSDTEEQNDLLDFKTMIPLSIGTSIDALAVGFTLTFMVESIYLPCITIGFITFTLSMFAVLFANKIKDKVSSSPQKFGGIILILLSLKMLIEFLSLI